MVALSTSTTISSATNINLISDDDPIVLPVTTNSSPTAYPLPCVVTVTEEIVPLATKVNTAPEPAPFVVVGQFRYYLVLL